MASDIGLGILGTLLGTVAGSIVGGWFGLRQTKIQQEAENKRHQADAFLDEKADRLSKLYDHLIEVITLSSPHADSTTQEISEGLTIKPANLNNDSVPTSQELLKAQKHAMLFIEDEEGIKRINKAVGLWLPVLRAIESKPDTPSISNGKNYLCKTQLEGIRIGHLRMMRSKRYQMMPSIFSDTKFMGQSANYRPLRGL